MKNLKTFESWESGYYPAGAENDPSAPWNQRDPEYIRGIDMKSGDIKFEVVNSDYSEIAVIKDKAEGKLYAMTFDSTDDDFKDYLAVDREYIGRDEDGDLEYEYDWDNVEVDDEAIESYATDKASTEGLGKSLSDFEDGKISLLTPEVAKEVIDFYEFDVKRIEKSGKQTSYAYKDKYQKAKDAIEFLNAISQEKE
jgi:hypothetical protein